MCLAGVLCFVTIPTTAATECRLIFSLNPGRSGSGYLAHLLSQAKGVSAGHERTPTLFHKVWRGTKAKGMYATYMQRRQAKIPSIRSVLDRGRIYAESSHGFLKSFWDIVMDEFACDGSRLYCEDRNNCRIDIVVLERPLDQVVCSYYRRNWTAIHADWLDEPGSATSQLKTVPDPPASEIDNLVWYVMDHEAKVRAFRKAYDNDLYARVFFHQTSLASLQTFRGVESLFRVMNLEWASAAALGDSHGALRAIGHRINQNSPARKRIPCSSSAVEKSRRALQLKQIRTRRL